MKKYRYLLAAMGIFLLGQSCVNATSSSKDLEKYDFEDTKIYKKFIKILNKTNSTPELSRELKITAWLLDNSPAEIQHHILSFLSRETQAKFRLLGSQAKLMIDDIWSREHVTINGGITNYQYETDVFRTGKTLLVTKFLNKLPFERFSPLAIKIENKYNPYVPFKELISGTRPQGLSDVKDLERTPFENMTLNFKIWSKQDAKSLQKLTNVRHLNLHGAFDNPTENIYQYVIKNINKMIKLEYLDLSYNYSSIPYLIDKTKVGFKDLQNLKILILSDNRLEDSHIKKLRIKELKNLITLDLRDNKQLTPKIINYLEKNLPTTEILVGHDPNGMPE